MLTPLELDIMKVVWSCSPINVRSVQDAIRPARKLAYTTVMTIMDRLYHKGVLTRTLHSRTHYYQPAIAYAAVRDEALETLIRSFFGSKEHLQEFLNGNPASIPPQPDASALHAPRLDETLL